MTVGRRLQLTFLAMAALTGALGVFSHREFQRIAQPLSTDVPRSVEALKAAAEMDGLVQLVRYYDEILAHSLDLFVLTGERRWKERHHSMGAQMQGILEEAARTADPADPEWEIFRDMKERYESISAVEHEILRHIERGQSAAAESRLEDADYLLQKRLFRRELQEYTALRGLNEDRVFESSALTVKKAAQDARGMVERSGRLVVLFILLVIAAALFMGYFLTRAVTDPLKALTSQLKQAAGDTLRIRPDAGLLRSRDEIGDLARAFDAMIHKRREAEEALRNLSQNLEATVRERTRELEAQRTAALNMMEDAQEARQKAEDAEERLKRQKKELERVNQELDGFVYTASHDLRAPLRGISSFASFLKKDCAAQLDQNGMGHLEEIQKGTQRMSRLIEDLLMLSRVSRIRNPYEEADVKSLLASVLERLEFDIKQKNVDIRLQKDLPRIYCDRIKVTELFSNLVNNAVKFSSKNGSHKPVVEIGYRREGREHIFHVKDNGIGIDSRYHDQVFGMFKRLHTEQEYEGTGAGLSIAKKIVDDHGGRIWIDSQAGRGACFYVSFPVNMKAPQTKQGGK